MDAVTEFLTSATAPPELQAASINPAQWAVAGASKVDKLLSRVAQIKKVIVLMAYFVFSDH